MTTGTPGKIITAVPKLAAAAGQQGLTQVKTWCEILQGLFSCYTYYTVEKYTPNLFAFRWC